MIPLMIGSITKCSMFYIFNKLLQHESEANQNSQNVTYIKNALTIGVLLVIPFYVCTINVFNIFDKSESGEWIIRNGRIELRNRPNRVKIVYEIKLENFDDTVDKT